jgi:hypothetical protein
MNTNRSYARLIVLLVLASVMTGTAAAQSQWDISINIPYYGGVTSESGSFGEFSQWLFVIPDVTWHYYFGKNESIRFGTGLKMYSVVVESMIYPVISLESILGDFVLDARFGGGLIFLFGLETQFIADAIFLPEVSVAYRLGKKKIFRLGTAATFVVAPVTSDIGGFTFIGSVFTRWTF